MKKALVSAIVVGLVLMSVAGIAAAPKPDNNPGKKYSFDYYVHLDAGNRLNPLLTDHNVLDGWCGSAVVNWKKGGVSGRFADPPGTTQHGCLVPYEATSSTGVTVFLNWAAWAGGGGFDDQDRLVRVWFAFNDVPDETAWDCDIIDVQQPAKIPATVHVNNVHTCEGRYQSGYSGPPLGTIQVEIGTMMFEPV